MSNEDMTTLLDEFRSMIFDKSFLISFVKTLEAQPRFSLQEKLVLYYKNYNDLYYCFVFLQGVQLPL